MALTNVQKKDLLSEHFMLKHIPESDLEKLVEASETKVFPADATIFKKGEIATAMMVVVQGGVRISAPATAGDDVTFATIRAGEVFGEIALIDGYERSADAVSIEETELLIVNNSDFLPFLQGNTDLCIDLLKVLCNRIRQTNVILEDFSYIDLRQRLAKRLMYMSGSDSSGSSDGSISVRVSQQQLIVMMGVSKDAVEHELDTWIEAGVITREADWISVVDAEKLSHLVQEI